MLQKALNAAVWHTHTHTHTQVMIELSHEFWGINAIKPSLRPKARKTGVFGCVCEFDSALSLESAYSLATWLSCHSESSSGAEFWSKLRITLETPYRCKGRIGTALSTRAGGQLGRAVSCVYRAVQELSKPTSHKPLFWKGCAHTRRHWWLMTITEPWTEQDSSRWSVVS